MEEHSNTDRVPYKFNGKELDEETGLYYYGARYYDARTSVWTAVDPLAEKYSAYSSYVYVANNPINAVDPDGRLIIFVNGHRPISNHLTDSYRGGRISKNDQFNYGSVSDVRLA